MRATQGTGAEISFLIPASLLSGCRRRSGAAGGPNLRVEEQRDELYIAPEGAFDASTLRESLWELLRVPSSHPRLYLDLSRAGGFDARCLDAVIEVLNQCCHGFQVISIAGINQWLQAHQEQFAGQCLLGPTWSSILEPEGLTLAKAQRRSKGRRGHRR